MLAERIRRHLAACQFAGADGEPFAVTCSIGVAQLRPETEDATGLFERVDVALYRAKHLGRNRVCLDMGAESDALANEFEDTLV